MFNDMIREPAALHINMISYELRWHIVLYCRA